MRSVIICLLSLLFVPQAALGALVGNEGLPSLSSHPPSTRPPSVNQPGAHGPPIQLPPINPPSTHPPAARLPSIHQLPIPQPPTHRRPVAPLAHPPPPHGQIVAFQGTHGPHAGVVLGSRPDQQRKFKVAPVKYVGQLGRRPVFTAPYTHVVKVHQNDIVGSRATAPRVASHLMQHHAQNPPVEMHAAGPVYGSRNYAALHGRPGGSRQG